jgi:hypothetical protein
MRSGANRDHAEVVAFSSSVKPNLHPAVTKAPIVGPRLNRPFDATFTRKSCQSTNGREEGSYVEPAEANPTQP